MKELVLIKLGGSVITGKSQPYTVKSEVISFLAQEIKEAWDKGYRFVISHGSGSFGHTSAAKYQTADGLKKKEDVFGLAKVQGDAFKINRIVNEIFLKEGLPCLSFMPSSFSFSSNKKLTGIFIKPIVEALKKEALPLVFGDVILDDSLGCCIYSGETTLDNLIKPLEKAGFKIIKVIQCGNTNGVYDEKGGTMTKITPKSFKNIKKALKKTSFDVTGGMIHKIKESLNIAKKGIDSFIINGEKGNLLKAILEEKVEGTLITNKD